jgi:predicted component of type VI protein secretion system
MEQTFDRPPVFVGRNPGSDLVLDSPGVSKTHACIDVRGGAIWVRDCGSANGTLLDGEPLAAHRWARAHGGDREVEVRISGWTLTIRPVTVAGPRAPAPEATLRDFLRRAPAVAAHAPTATGAGEGQTVVLSAQRPAPVPTRSQEATPPEGSLASTAFEQMQELARWYLGPGRALVTQADVLAFKEHQRRALDEMIVGFTKLVGGLEQFEQELALRGSGPAHRSPEDLVRDLLDWSRPQDDALQSVRAGFADLMMHQVALMHGVMRGVQAILAELSPAAIEAAARERRGKKLFGRLDLWGVYRERHADFADEEGERFRVLFGAQFAEEYRALARETRAAPSAPGAGETVPLHSLRRP